MDETTVAVYHARASQLANAMDLCHDDIPAYSAAIGLLAVHSAISYNDAVLVRLTGKRPRAQDHRKAIAAIRSACTQGGIGDKGVKHLHRLVSAKADVSYGDEQVKTERIEFLYEAAKRFQAWAEHLLG